MSRLSCMIMEMLNLFMEARIDIKNQGENSDLRIMSSDAAGSISSPEWFSKNGTGYVVKSREFHLALDITCVKDGLLCIWLRTNDVRDTETGKRIPIWMDYTGLFVDGEAVLKDIVPVQHDQAYQYQKKVKDGDNLRLEIHWQPHKPNSLEMEASVVKLCNSYISRFCMEEINHYGKWACQTIKRDLKKQIHLSIMGICVSRDFVNMKEADGCVVDRFIQDINPISLDYSSLLGGDICLPEEDIKKYLVNKELNHFHLRNILLDFNKTAYEYLFDVRSDYLILDTGCLRFHVMIDEKRKRAITQFLMRKIHWDTEGYKEISVMDLQEDIFRKHMDNFVQTMLKHYPQDRIILVEVYQADFYIDKNGQNIRKFYGDNSEGNCSIRRGFEYLVKALPKAHVIPFIRNVIGDERHKWKLGNLHFVPEYYEYGHKALLAILTSHDIEQEHRELGKLRWEYERKIDYNYFFRIK